MPDIILITLVKNLSRILKNETRSKKVRKGGGVQPPPINTSPIYIYIHLFNVRDSVHVYSCRTQPTKFTTKIYTETSAHKIRIKAVDAHHSFLHWTTILTPVPNLAFANQNITYRLTST